MFFHLNKRMATMMLRNVTFNEIKCHRHVTPFGGRNPKVGVSHVHLCLSSFHVCECLTYLTFSCFHVMLFYNLDYGFSTVEDNEEELLYCFLFTYSTVLIAL